jgi:protein-S-isoprenylcysteine O-methyltransferase Ste14
MSGVAWIKSIALSLLGVAVIWFFAVSLPFHIGDWDSGSLPFEAGVLGLLGWIAIALGGSLILWCYYLFLVVGRGTPWPFDPPKKLVVAGPYRIVRNPMEVSFLMIVLGEAFLFRSIALIVYGAISFALLHVREVFVEEPELRRRFGVPYEHYIESVPRWIPRLTPFVGGR